MAADLAPSLKRLLPWLVAIAFFMEALDTTILNTAVPIVSTALKVTPLSMKSVLSSYTLSLAVFIPLSSWVADRFGTRRVFGTAIGLFTLGSLLCGFSTGIHWLVACRILQGCGGAMMVPVGRMTLVRSFAKSELVSAMSFVAIPALIGPLLGPLAGGLIVGYWHWRMIFFVNVPIGLIGLYFIYRKLPDYHGVTHPLDVVGSILFGAGIAIFSYVLEVFGEHTLDIGGIVALLALSGSLLLAYFHHVKRTAFPVLRLNLLRIRTLRISVLGNLVTRLGVGGLPFLLPLLYQIGLGYSPVESGLLIMPQTVAAIILKATVPSILTRFGYRQVLLTNTILIGLLIMTFAVIDVGSPVWVILLQGTLFGFFSSLQYTCLNTLVFADVDDADTSMTSTIASTVQQLSLSFGIAVSSLIASFFIADRMHATSRQLLHGIHRAFICLGLLTLVSGLLFRALKKTDGENVSQYKKPMEIH